MRTIKGLLLMSNLMLLGGSIWFIVTCALAAASTESEAYSMAFQFVASFTIGILGLVLHVCSALALDFIKKE